MRKPLKIYLFFLLLITAFGVLGNILIQDDPNLEATDINDDIPGSETMVAIYEPVAAALGDDAIVDIAVLPTDDSYDVTLLLHTDETAEQVLQQQTVDVLQLVEQATAVKHVQVEWLNEEETILSVQVAIPSPTTAEALVTEAAHYAYTP